jgi:hypothetical protein
MAVAQVELAPITQPVPEVVEVAQEVTQAMVAMAMELITLQLVGLAEEVPEALQPVAL